MAGVTRLGWILCWATLIAVLRAHYVRLAADCGGPVCLYLYEDTVQYKTWQQSYEACRTEGLYLVRIETSHIQTAMERLLTNLPNDAYFAWTGGRGSSYNTWKYMNGTDFPYEVVGSETSAHCLYVRLHRRETNNIHYYASPCDENEGPSQVLCQYEASSTATGHCNPPDLSRQGMCYKKTRFNGVDPDNIDWFGAQSYCSGDGIHGDIAFSNLDTLRVAISNHVAEGDADSVQLWLGVRRRIWHWSTGPDAVHDRLPMEYFNWAVDVSHHSTYTQCVCTVNFEDDRWSLAQCTNSMRLFICMGDIPTTTTTTASLPPATTTTVTSRLPPATTTTAQRPVPTPTPAPTLVLTPVLTPTPILPPAPTIALTTVQTLAPGQSSMISDESLTPGSVHVGSGIVQPGSGPPDSDDYYQAVIVMGDVIGVLALVAVVTVTWILCKSKKTGQPDDSAALTSPETGNVTYERVYDVIRDDDARISTGIHLQPLQSMATCPGPACNQLEHERSCTNMDEKPRTHLKMVEGRTACDSLGQFSEFEGTESSC